MLLKRYAHVWEMAVFGAVFPLVNLKVPFPVAGVTLDFSCLEEKLGEVLSLSN